MKTTNDAFREYARLSRKYAVECRDEAANEAKDSRRQYLTSEAARHDERADWYEDRIWYAEQAALRKQGYQEAAE